MQRGLKFDPVESTQILYHPSGAGIKDQDGAQSKKLMKTLCLLFSQSHSSEHLYESAHHCFNFCVHVCVCVWVDMFCFLVCGATALQAPSLEVVGEGCYSVFVCVCMYGINKWQKNTHTENVMCFCW